MSGMSSITSKIYKGKPPPAGQKKAAPVSNAKKYPAAGKLLLNIFNNLHVHVIAKFLITFLRLHVNTSHIRQTNVGHRLAGC